MAEEVETVLEEGESFRVDNLCTVDELWSKVGDENESPENILSLELKITLLGKGSKKSSNPLNSKPKQPKLDTLHFAKGDAETDLYIQVDGFYCGVNRATLTGKLKPELISIPQECFMGSSNVSVRLSICFHNKSRTLRHRTMKLSTDILEV